jgi:hypothetical protein
LRGGNCFFIFRDVFHFLWFRVWCRTYTPYSFS